MNAPIPPMDPSAPGVLAADVPIVENVELDPFERAGNAAITPVSFTVFAAPGKRMSKRYKLAVDGRSVEADSGTQFATGSYAVIKPATSDPQSALAEIGTLLDQLPSHKALGLGVPLDGTMTGQVTTKARHAAGNDADAIPRTLEHFGWPEGHGLLLIDGDDIDGLREVLCDLHPGFADVACLVRPSASASVKDPQTGKALKTGEHCYVVIDNPALSKDCLDALLRLSWCRGSGKSAGFLKLTKAGSVLVYGPVDTSVGSPERLSYEGAAVIGKGLTALPRNSVVTGGTGMLCAADLLAYADLHAPADLFEERVNAVKLKPDFVAQRTAMQGVYRETHVKAAVKRGIPREKAEADYDEAVAAGSRTIGRRTFVPLPNDHTLFWPDGRSFTVADIKQDPRKFHGKECADPIEGLDYKTRNPGIMHCDAAGTELVIYSRAHGDAFAYVVPLLKLFEWEGVLARIAGRASASGGASVSEPEPTAADVDPVDLWAKFDPPTLPRGVLPEVIEAFAFDRGTAMGCDLGGLAVSALAVCAAAIPDSIKLQPKKHDTEWLESARLWVAPVGLPSTMKTPMMAAAAKPLRRIDYEMARDNQDAMNDWLRLPKEEQRATPRPKQPRLVIEDTTIEAAQEVLKDSPTGVLSYQDELSGWFGAMDKYSGGKGAAADRGFWLKTFNGDNYSVNRIGRGSSVIEGCSVSMLGGIQPEPIRKLAEDGVDDGLLQRLIPIVLRPAVVSRDEKPSESLFHYNKLIRDLHELKPPMTGGLLLTVAPLKFDEGALAIRAELEKKHLELAQCESLNRKLTSHIGKYNGIFARLCVVWHCVEHAGGEIPGIITEATARRTAGFLHGYLLPHAMAFYAGVLGLSNEHDALTAIAGYILAHSPERITYRDCMRGDTIMKKLKPRDAEVLFEQLHGLGWVTRTPGPRPSTQPHWIVNPVVHEKFAERGKAEAERRERDRATIVEITRRAGS
jgi:hypothetical protein